jgi:hypothetical protein
VVAVEALDTAQAVAALVDIDKASLALAAGSTSPTTVGAGGSRTQLGLVNGNQRRSWYICWHPSNRWRTTVADILIASWSNLAGQVAVVDQDTRVVAAVEQAE